MELQSSEPTSGGAAAPFANEDERRQGRRHVAVLRVAKVIRDHGDELCVIRNISDGGVMAHLYATARVGERVAIAFKSGARLTGSVRWVRGDDAGIAFDRTIDMERFLAGEGDMPGALAPRAPRLDIGLPAVARIGVRMQAVTICDISQGGLKMRALPDVEPGRTLVVRVAGLPPLPGTVRWTDAHYAGVEFDTPLVFTTLARWAAATEGRR